MKVACIGNMNNNFFSITRYLRDYHIDATLLLLDNEFPHFHPSCDSYDEEYKSYTKQLTWGRGDRFLRTSNYDVEKDTKDYDFVFGCGGVPAFLNRIGRKVDIMVPYGGDILTLPFFTFKIHPKRYLNFFSFSRNQQRGIRNARYISLDRADDLFEASIRELKYSGKRIDTGIPMVYTRIYNPTSIPAYYKNSAWYGRFAEIREENELMIFYHNSHLWKSRMRFEKIAKRYWNNIRYSKGTDLFFKGFGKFVEGRKGTKSCVVTFEYGYDVEATKEFVKELGIEDRVIWFPKMSRKDIMIGLSLADIGVGELEMSWLSYGVAYEVLALGKPLMAFRDDALYQNNHPELYAMMNVSSEDEIEKQLIRYCANKKYYQEMGEEGRLWLQKYAIDQPIEEYIKIIGQSI